MTDIKYGGEIKQYVCKNLESQSIESHVMDKKFWPLVSIQIRLIQIIA